MNQSPIDTCKFVFGSPIIGLLATTNGDCDYVSLKDYQGCVILIASDNATTVTAGDITLKQATAVAGTGEKALAFTKMYANADVSASDTVVETAVTSNTFATQAVDNKNSIYLIDVKASDLDVAGGFDCLRVDVLNSVASVAFVGYVLYGPRYAPTIARAAITD